VAIEYYGDQDSPKAIVIRVTEKVEGINFFTPLSYSQQVGLMTRPKGHVVPTHQHNLVERTILHTQEVLVIRKGECEVTLYDQQLNVTNSIHLFQGDTILLAHDPHRIEMISECEILEIKQGPYAGENDKTILGSRN
jgi:mannose-6-phosphate isomerase-like protein (cupin superfamily)